jgi:hypothetical protein
MPQCLQDLISSRWLRRGTMMGVKRFFDFDLQMLISSAADRVRDKGWGTRQ